jgi:hypothetical protein
MKVRLRKRKRYFFRNPYKLRIEDEYLNSFYTKLTLDCNGFSIGSPFGAYAYLLNRRISDDNIDRLVFTPYKKAI